MADFFTIMPASPPPLSDSYLDWDDDDDDDYGGFTSAPSLDTTTNSVTDNGTDPDSCQSSERGAPMTLPSELITHSSTGSPPAAMDYRDSETIGDDEGSKRDEPSRVSVTDSGVYSYDTSPDIKTCMSSKNSDSHKHPFVEAASERTASSAEMNNGEVFDRDCRKTVAAEVTNVNADCQNISNGELDYTDFISVNPGRTFSDAERITTIETNVTHDDSHDTTDTCDVIHSICAETQDADIASTADADLVCDSLNASCLSNDETIELENRNNNADEMCAKQSDISRASDMFVDKDGTEDGEQFIVEPTDDCNDMFPTTETYMRSLSDEDDVRNDDIDDDDDDGDFADFSSSAGPSGVALLAEDSDNGQTWVWDAFGDMQSIDDSSVDDWATFQDSAVKDAFDDADDDADDDDDFGNFEGGASTITTPQQTTTAAVKSDKPLGSGIPMTSALLACFPQTTSSTPTNTTERLAEVLTRHMPREIAANVAPPSSFDYHQKSTAHSTLNVNVWHNLKNLHSTVALKYQWLASTNRHKLIRALQMDPSNMLFHARKPGMPAFASALGMLEPKRGGETVPPSEPVIVDTSTSADSDSSSQDIPAVDFDWNSSGLTNPLDALQKEQEILQAIDAEPSPQPAGLQPLQNILANLKFVTTTTTTTSEPVVETLDQQVVKALSALPDLSFMSSKVLMFPIKGDTQTHGMQ